jgi:isoleucyl-tRNA synthetase
MEAMSETTEKKAVYNPKEVEDSYYKIWEDRGYFEIDGNRDIQEDGKNFAIMMPPPNVTGSLHIGHALHLHYKTSSHVTKEWTDTKHSGSREPIMPVSQRKT